MWYTGVYMLVFDREGYGPPLMLLHGTNSSRSIWKPLLPQLSSEREVFSVDLPAHGQSPPSSFTPPGWATEVAALLDHLGLERVALVGHSAGGWTALELAKLGRTSGVLALTPAGLWRKHSPPITDAIRGHRRLGQLLGERAATTPLRTNMGRRMSLRQISRSTGRRPRRGCDRNGQDSARVQALPRALPANPPAAVPGRPADPCRHPGPRRLGWQGSHRPRPNITPHRPAPRTRDRRNLGRSAATCSRGTPHNASQTPPSPSQPAVKAARLRVAPLFRAGIARLPLRHSPGWWTTRRTSAPGHSAGSTTST